MMESNTAFLVMSYNHPDTAKEVLANTVEMYGRYGMDIYYYDSSEADDTKILVEEYIQAGARNLFYVDMRSVSADYKVLQVLSGVGLKKHYDYVFLIKDRAYFDEATIQKLYEVAKDSYDAILLPPRHWPLDVYPQPKTEVYTDPVELFRDYGVVTVDWEVLLLNYDTILKRVDWEDIKARYYPNGKCNIASLQVTILFMGLARLNNPRVRVLREEEVHNINSSKSASTWGDRIFYMWCEAWPREIDMLPECYDEYKPYVKKKQTMQMAIFGNPYMLMLYVEKGMLTTEVAEKYRDVWADLSDIPYECLEYIINGEMHLWMKRLLLEWVTYFRKQKFPQAYHMFYNNNWLEDIYGSDIHNILRRCFDIYVLELQQEIEEGIFLNVYSANDVVNKYKTMKDMLKRLEDTDDYETMNDIVPYFAEQRVTGICLSYIIQIEFGDAEKVASRWNCLYAIYEERCQ